MNLKTLVLNILLFSSYLSYSQFEENNEKFTVLGGVTSTGSEFIIWSDNIYGGNVQFIYDVKKIEEGAIALKGSYSWADGFNGYYGGANIRIGSVLFADFDFLVGHSSVKNPELLKSYVDLSADEYKGPAFVGNIGFGYRFPTNPLLLRFSFNTHFPFNERGLNSGYNLQVGYRF